MDLIQLIEVNW